VHLKLTRIHQGMIATILTPWLFDSFLSPGHMCLPDIFFRACYSQPWRKFVCVCVCVCETGQSYCSNSQGWTQAPEFYWHEAVWKHLLHCFPYWSGWCFIVCKRYTFSVV